MRNIATEGNIFPQINAVNLAAGLNDSIARIDMMGYEALNFVIIHNVGTAAEPIVATLSQHDNQTIGAGNTKALEMKNGIWVKAHVDIETAFPWVKYTPGATPATCHVWTESVLEKEAIIVIPVHAGDLDSANGYQFCSLGIADTGNGACIGVCFALGLNPRVTPPPDATL